jgi:hypothetical protein
MVARLPAGHPDDRRPNRWPTGPAVPLRRR